MVNLFDPALIILSGERMRFDYLYAADTLAEMEALVLDTGRPLPPIEIHAWGEMLWAQRGGGAGAFCRDRAAAGLAARDGRAITRNDAARARVYAQMRRGGPERIAGAIRGMRSFGKTGQETGLAAGRTRRRGADGGGAGVDRRHPACLLGRNSAALADTVDFRVQGAQADLTRALRAASPLLSAERDDRTDAQDLFAAAQAEYAGLLAALYARAHFAPVIAVTVDGREAAGIPALDFPPRVGQIVVTVDPGPSLCLFQGRRSRRWPRARSCPRVLPSASPPKPG